MQKIVSGICPKTNAEKQITVEYRQIGADGIRGNTKGSYRIVDFTCDENCNLDHCPIYENSPATY